MRSSYITVYFCHFWRSQTRKLDGETCFNFTTMWGCMIATNYMDFSLSSSFCRHGVISLSMLYITGDTVLYVPSRWARVDTVDNVSQTGPCLKPSIVNEEQARVSAVIGRREREKIRLAVCARETDILACIEKMAAAPIPPVYSGHFFSIPFAPLYLIYRALPVPCLASQGRARILCYLMHCYAFASPHN